MKTTFLSKFDKDLDKIKQNSVREEILNTILEVESANNLQEITHLKKLKGFKDAYRIRVGNYRIGIFVEDKNIIFARVLHRKDIYELFP